MNPADDLEPYNTSQSRGYLLHKEIKWVSIKCKRQTQGNIKRADQER